MNETNMHRGFASMTPERRREISTLGGKAAHVLGKAHKFSTEEAKLAGAIGGRKVAMDRSHMAKIGSLGGRSSANKRLKK